MTEPWLGENFNLKITQTTKRLWKRWWLRLAWHRTEVHSICFGCHCNLCTCVHLRSILQDYFFVSPSYKSKNQTGSDEFKNKAHDLICIKCSAQVDGPGSCVWNISDSIVLPSVFNANWNFYFSACVCRTKQNKISKKKRVCDRSQ